MAQGEITMGVSVDRQDRHPKSGLGALSFLRVWEKRRNQQRRQWGRMKTMKMWCHGSQIQSFLGERSVLIATNSSSEVRTEKPSN